MPARPLLLIEDDPVSAGFLTAVLADCGEVIHAASLADAVRHLQQADAVAAVVSDCRLPDGHATALPGLLAAAGRELPPALALSADPAGEDPAALHAAGFAAVLGKPITADTLQAAVRRLLGDSPATPWDDAAAQRTLGLAPAQRRQLRLLLLQELPRQRGHIAEALARGDHARLEAELHRLRSACGFCGAADLLAASIALASEPGSARWRDFDAACAALLADGLASA